MIPKTTISKILNLDRKESGITIIESLIAILVVISAITGAFSLINRNLSSATIVKDEVVAAQLAQEGIEVVRNLRDGDWHSGRAFGTSIPNGIYRIQWDSTLLPFVDDFLKLDPDTGIYSYDIGNQSCFKRKITISMNIGEESIRRIIIVIVTWTEQSVLKTIQAEEHLYNWCINTITACP